MALWKKQNLKEAEEEIIAIEDDGHHVFRCTDYHWKINDMDVWPSVKKFMKNGVVKHYQKLKEII